MALSSSSECAAACVHIIRVCVSVCVSVCNFGWMNGRMKLEVHRRIRVQTHTHPHIHTHTHTGARTRTSHPQPQWPRLGEPPDPSPIGAAVHVCASGVAHACMHVSMYAWMHARVCVCFMHAMHACMMHRMHVHEHEALYACSQSVRARARDL